MHRLRDFPLLAALATAAAVMPALGQTAAPAGSGGNGTQSSTIPDFSGTWGRYSFPGLASPQSGPGPVVNTSRRRQSFDDNGRPFAGAGGAAGAANAPLVSNNTQLVGDYTNPILKPLAGKAVKEHGEIELGGWPAPNPSNECWPSGVPFVLWNLGMQMLQQPDKITFLYVFDHEVRHVRLNQSHPAQLTTSWYGDSVGQYEGDTLVIDTVGFKVGPFSMVDHYGTPHTEALHVVERYRLLDYEAAKEALARDAKENFRFNPRANDYALVVDPAFKGKHLVLDLTVEDPGVFTVPWSATVIYQPASGEWPEFVCAENPHELARKSAIPIADKPDF
jgi:hypothetical protein